MEDPSFPSSSTSLPLPSTTETPSQPPEVERFDAIVAEDACRQAAAREADADALADSADEAAPSDRQMFLDEARANRQRAADLGYPCG